MITLRREQVQAVPQRPVRRPMGPERADTDGLEKGPPRTRPTGEAAKVELRDVFDALLCINRTGILWNPHDLPGHGTVYLYCAAWRDEGILAQLTYDLTGLARIKDGRKPEPTASVIDTRSVKTLNTASRARRCKGPQLRAPGSTRNGDAAVSPSRRWPPPVETGSPVNDVVAESGSTSSPSRRCLPGELPVWIYGQDESSLPVLSTGL
ncbi:hypothetical protein QFZ63_000277 [Streptomyces sp. B3I7]|nr:hypothetical protein [Streptomyces sp. B3I7]